MVFPQALQLIFYYRRNQSPSQRFSADSQNFSKNQKASISCAKDTGFSFP
jgi:hypothetical protein